METKVLNQLKITRSCGVEYYPVEKALWEINTEKSADNTYPLYLNIQFEKGTVLCDDTAMLDEKPSWHLETPLKEEHVIKGLKVEIANEPVAFSYDRLKDTLENVVEVLEVDGDKLLIELTGKTIDVNMDEDSEPDTILQVTAWFRPKEVYKINSALLGELEIIERNWYHEYFNIVIDNEEMEIQFEIIDEFKNNSDVNIVGNLIDRIPQMYPEAIKFIHDNKERHEWIVDFCAYHIEAIDLSAFFDKGIKITIKMIIDLLEFVGVSINEDSDGIYCCFDFVLPEQCSNETLKVYFNTKYELYECGFAGTRWPHSERPPLWYVKNDSRYFLKQ
ncbi:hypothetical protein ACFFLS_04795 [Flavobacterium procerum]|uniref:DUF4261 domain-containing protein n=1 Tax=Flavobacterium procerum TaxID=1455569 RepID=A0ABV6BLN0_9FLAO